MHTTVTALSAQLHARYPEDVAQEALVALLKLVGTDRYPKNPWAYVNRAAWCIQVKTRYQGVGHRPGRRNKFVHVSPGPEESRRVDRVFGLTPATQLDRAVARQHLDRLHMVDILGGLGYLDPVIPRKRRGYRLATPVTTKRVEREY